jgi:ribosomal protein S18 acetylase RimI-like enzyme
MDNIQIHYLADKKEHINACSAWAYGRWGVQKENSSLEQTIKKFTEGAQKDALPLTLIATTSDTNLPVAMASLWKEDGDVWPDKTPWIASVYTLYRYRDLGLATRLIKELEQVAKNLNYDEIFLQSGSAKNLYIQMGYKELENIETCSTAVGQLTLLTKEI